MWQDSIFSIGSLIFAVALIPSILSKDKPAIMTSFTTGSVLLVFSMAYFTLGLWVATFINGIVGAMWLYLAWQKYRKV